MKQFEERILLVPRILDGVGHQVKREMVWSEVRFPNGHLEQSRCCNIRSWLVPYFQTEKIDRLTEFQLLQPDIRLGQRLELDKVLHQCSRLGLRFDLR